MTTRRQFLKTAAAATAAASPYFFTGSNVLVQDAKAQEKNDRPLIGQIGCGGQGNGITGAARGYGDVVAVCDVDSQRAEESKQKNGGGKAEVYEDYRKLLDRKDIDVVTIGTPDHWHSKIAIEAMQAGKDVYCEKPLTLTIEEGQQIIKVLDATKRVFQVGTQQRSSGPFAQAVAMCRDGRLGKIKEIWVAIGAGDKGGPFQKQKPPANLNWEMWLGQAPLVDYIPQRCHYQFRWWYEYSGGKMTDWGAHHVDIAHWVVGADDTGPVSFDPKIAEFPVPFEKGYPTKDDHYNTAIKFRIDCPLGNDGAKIVICNIVNKDTCPEANANFDNGLLVVGDKGRIQFDRGKLVGGPVEGLKDQPLPGDAIKKLYKGKNHGNHMGNFFECIKTREQPISDVHSHHRAMTTCHLANIACRLGRKIQWDPKTEKIVGDEEAAKWTRREQRKGYEIKV
jgi:predicted dehydrogenase